jgi:hypothetical protein
MAKEVSTEQSAAFLNGVLDAVLKENQALVAGIPAAEPAATTEAPAADFSPS